MSAYSLVRSGIRLGAIAALSEYPTTPVIFSHSSGTEPAESYAVINILSIEQKGHHQTSTLANNTTEKTSISVAYEVSVQFSFVGSLSGELAQSFSQRINNNSLTFEELGRNKLGVLRKTQIRRAPQKRETSWVDNFNIDVVFSYILNTQQLVDIIEAVQIEDTLVNEIYTVPPGIVITP